jgi:serine protease AprX
MNNGNGTPASYTECYEWFVAPYPPGGNPMTDGDPSLAPHVINNSWGCPPGEGCSPGILEAVVNNVRAAGIVTVHSAGNSGSDCGSVDDPAGTYPASFTVGATDSLDNIASFSSRGPSAFDGGLKPDISAPGVSIRSTIRGGGYGNSYQGTSMAAPHVAGLVALLISANPSLAGDVAAIEAILQGTAVPRTTTQGCGSDTPTSVPNNVYGYGRIDALTAILPPLTEKVYLPLVNQ